MQQHSILALIAWAIFLGVFLYQSWHAYLAYLSANWVAVSAKVLEADIAEFRVRNQTPRYRPKIKYEYKVGGKSHFSNRISFQTTSSYRYSDIAEVMNEFTVGEDIIVYHDPRIHRRAVIRKGMTYMNILFPAILLFVLVVLYLRQR